MEARHKNIFFILMVNRSRLTEDTLQIYIQDNEAERRRQLGSWNLFCSAEDVFFQEPALLGIGYIIDSDSEKVN